MRQLNSQKPRLQIAIFFGLLFLCLYLGGGAGCGSGGSAGNNNNNNNGGNGPARTEPLGPRSVTFVNLCQQSIAVAALGNNDPSGSQGTTAACALSTPAGSPCRCTSDSQCLANEYCGQVPNRTGTACSSDANCNTSQGEYCDKTFDPSHPQCSFRLCSYVPADPNGLATEVSPKVSCANNSACAAGQWCNSASSTCYNLPTDGGNGWVMAQGATPLTVTFPEPWAGRFWARTGCDATTYQCDSGQCDGCISNGKYQPGLCTATNLPTSLHCANSGISPATLAELNMQDFTAGDFYDISNVDSANLSVEIVPDPKSYNVTSNINAVSGTACTQDTDCNPLFGAHIWKCDTNLQKCVNPFTCGSPGCTEAGGCAAQGLQAALLPSCPWAPGSDLAIPQADCDSPLQVLAGGNYVGCNSPKEACLANPPPAPAQLNCDGASMDLYQCVGTNAQSCFTAGAGASCCGCPSWVTAVANGACQNTNPNWTSQVQPLVDSFNTACPTSYSFPFDDAIKLFSCQSTNSSTYLNYTVTFCPQRGS
ncbi:MAG: thaumatin family protein [bacterium]